jgi:hypothetical protein
MNGAGARGGEASSLATGIPVQGSSGTAGQSLKAIEAVPERKTVAMLSVMPKSLRGIALAAA